MGAGRAGPIDDCNQQEDVDRRLRGCSRLIEEGGSDKEKLAAAYINRGNAYFGKRDYDRAIADYSKVIELNARHTEAYNNRGAAYEKKDDHQRAIADYRKAFSIDPHSRGAALAKDNLRRLGR
jgi:tetratricopeptide (TPR) repeat protein